MRRSIGLTITRGRETGVASEHSFARWTRKPILRGGGYEIAQTAPIGIAVLSRRTGQDGFDQFAARYGKHGIESRRFVGAKLDGAGEYRQIRHQLIAAR